MVDQKFDQARKIWVWIIAATDRHSLGRNLRVGDESRYTLHWATPNVKATYCGNSDNPSHFVGRVDLA